MDEKNDDSLIKEPTVNRINILDSNEHDSNEELNSHINTSNYTIGISRGMNILRSGVSTLFNTTSNLSRITIDTGVNILTYPVRTITKIRDKLNKIDEDELEYTLFLNYSGDEASIDLDEPYILSDSDIDNMIMDHCWNGTLDDENITSGVKQIQIETSDIELNS